MSFPVTHPYPSFNGGVTKPPLKLGHGWVMTSLASLRTEAQGCQYNLPIQNVKPHQHLPWSWKSITIWTNVMERFTRWQLKALALMKLQSNSVTNITLDAIGNRDNLIELSNRFSWLLIVPMAPDSLTVGHFTILCMMTSSNGNIFRVTGLDTRGTTHISSCSLPLEIGRSLCSKAHEMSRPIRRQAII